MTHRCSTRLHHHASRTLRAVACALVALSAVGCNPFNRETPSTAQFMLTPQPTVAHEGVRLGTLAVRRVAVQSPFDTRGFVYRTTHDQWRTDAYNAFLADPGDMIGNAMVHALDGSGRFTLVTSGALTAATDLAAESVVEEFFSDFSEPAHPVARVSLRIYLLDRSKMGAVRAVLAGAAVEPIASDAPGAVSDALSVAVAKAIDQAIAQLPPELQR